MVDSGNATTIGHRRWILSNSLGPIGIGGTDRASCMWTLSGTGRAGKTLDGLARDGQIAAAGAAHRGIADSTRWPCTRNGISLNVPCG